MKEIIKKFELNLLGDELINIIINRTNIFKPLTIVVPNNKIEQWFKAYWLKHQKGILMNVNFKLIDKALKDLINCDKEYDLINQSHLKALIIKHLVTEKIVLPKEVKEYIYVGDGFDQIKLYDLANKLASLFIEYEKDMTSIIGWQEELYITVLENALEYNLISLRYLYQKYNSFNNNNNDDIYFFGFVNLSNLHIDIINSYASFHNVKMLLLEKDIDYKSEFDLISAPSKLREIEVVHSKICSLLLDDSNSYGDFLVIAPNISEYEDVIPRVFIQDGKEYPNIPFVINDRKKIETNVFNALSILVDIANKKYFSRLDFFNLISNKDVQTARNITNDDVDNWSRYLVDINAFRNSTERDDWEYARNRILLSKVSSINDFDNSVIELSGKKYLPFITIDFDDESIVKFVSIIDDLKNWLKLVNEIKFINSNNILLVKEELDKWCSVTDNFGFETNRYYKNIIKDINFWKQIEVSDTLIPRNSFFYSLLDASNVTKYKSLDYFVKGITFADFDPNVILSCKYVFFLNASSSNLPIQQIKSELDIRPYDVNDNELIENGFLIQYQNANKFYLSYVNKDLKTDEKFYPSSFVLNLMKTNKVNEKEIDIDETREWENLFTKKSISNKNYFNDLFKNLPSETDFLKETYKEELYKKVNIKDLADFLTEPLSNKAKRLFGYEDELDEQIQEEFEPFFNNNLIKSILFRKICIEALENGKMIIDKYDFEHIKERFNLQNKLPNLCEHLNNLAFDEIINSCQVFLNFIYGNVSGNIKPFKLDETSLQIGKNEIILTCNREVCLNVDGNTRTYFDIKELKCDEKNNFDPKNKDYLYIYIFSLVDILSLDEKTYNIILNQGICKTFEITPSMAKEILKKIYLEKIDYSNCKYVPISYYEDVDKITYEKMISKIDGIGDPWAYFKQRKLFDYDKNLGYEVENFQVQFKQNMNELVDLIKFIEPENLKGDDKNGK